MGEGKLGALKEWKQKWTEVTRCAIRTLTKERYHLHLGLTKNRAPGVTNAHIIMRKFESANFYFIGKNPKFATVHAAADKVIRPSNLFC